METQRICPNCRKPLSPDVPMGLCPECLIKSGFATGTDPGAPENAAARFVPPPVNELAPLFPQLEILEFIGKGGMGAVYKARQPALDRFVALKILPPATASDAGFAERFNREARALARLSHPNIVGVHDFGKAGALHYLLMEFVDGANLREVERAGKLSPEQALRIVPQICEALQFAHSEGIVHRDIKPENILLDKKGRVKITDFGIAKIIGIGASKAALTGAKDVVGTPHYMAPEQIEKPQTVDHRADIYSLGVVFYEMLTGELPLGKFAAPSAKVQVDVRLDDVVLRALEKEPERRYQQASALKTHVETIAADPRGARGKIISSSKRGTPSRRIHFKRGAVAGLLSGLIAVIVASAITFSLPRTYQADAKVLLRMANSPTASNQNQWRTVGSWDPYLLNVEVEIIKSRSVLDDVIRNLNLKDRWGKQYAGGSKLADNEAIELLRRRIQAFPVPDTSVIDIRVFSEKADDAAMFANAIADSYAAYHKREAVVSEMANKSSGARSVASGSGLIEVTIIDRAVPPLSPIRPNHILGVGEGIVIGMALAMFIGVLAGLISLWRAARAGKNTSADEAGSGRQPYGKLAFIFLIAGTLGTLALMTLSFRHELALTFGALALVLAFVFGLMGWQDRFGKFVVISLASLIVIVVAAALVFALRLPAQREAARRMQAQQQAEVEELKSIAAQRAKQSAESDAQNPDSAARTGPVQTIKNSNASQIPELEFRLVAEENDRNTPADELADPGDRTGQQKLRVLREVLLDGSAISKANLDTKQSQLQSDVKVINVKLKDPAAKKFADITTKNVGRRLAIVWRGRVLSAPVIRAPITGGFISITGNLSDAEWKVLEGLLDHDAVNAAQPGR